MTDTPQNQLVDDPERVARLFHEIYESLAHPDQRRPGGQEGHLMRLTDACSCGATFNSRGLPGWVAQLYAVWLNAHRKHRDDNQLVEFTSSTEDTR